ncbi:unnamed protein product [Rhizophagus irregularis]|nr:unnamed protein product [Rhizophagus irregularis]
MVLGLINSINIAIIINKGTVLIITPKRLVDIIQNGGRTKMVADERSRNHKKLSIRVNFEKEAIIWRGPYFWLQDLYIKSSGSFINNIVGKSKQHSYEKKIINRETFEIEEYEVFQVIDNRLSTFIFS